LLQPGLVECNLLCCVSVSSIRQVCMRAAEVSKIPAVSDPKTYNVWEM
jgi:hypothetical protein